MKKGVLASIYLKQYEDTDVVVTDSVLFDLSGDGGLDLSNPIAFDLSDGTHWFADITDTVQIASSVVDADIRYSDVYGWVIIEDGKEKEIDWI